MKTSKQIRLRKLDQLVAEYGTIEAVATAAGTAAQYLSQIRNKVTSASGTPRGIGDSLARKLELGCHKHPGWMDQQDAIEAATELSDLIQSSKQVFHSKVMLSPNATRLINEIIAAEERGSSSPQIIEVLSKVLHVAIPATEPEKHSRISKFIDDE
jgi:hypothetical protein